MRQKTVAIVIFIATVAYAFTAEPNFGMIGLLLGSALIVGTS